MCFAGSSAMCGGVLRDKSGYITSPDLNSDEQYDANLNCHWTIQAREGYVIRYIFLLLEIVGSNNCQKDYLSVCTRPKFQCLKPFMQMINSTLKQFCVLLIVPISVFDFKHVTNKPPQM